MTDEYSAHHAKVVKEYKLNTR
ncbi:hypothetical protein CCP3SC5AM1_2340001 [Gammaproteobacteria bacterium]